MVSTLNKWIVREYTELVKDADGVVLLSIDGLTVEEAQNMRNNVRTTGADLVFGKRRLVRVALREAGINLDDSAWESGNVALLVGNAEATIGAAKAIKDTFKKVKPDQLKIQYRGAMFDGSVMNATEAAGISGMPDRDTLRAMMCSALVGPARQIATLLKEVGASTARALQARADQEEAA